MLDLDGRPDRIEKDLIKIEALKISKDALRTSEAEMMSDDIDLSNIKKLPSKFIQAR